MLALPSQLPIYIAVKPVDFRKGIDGLQKLCKNKLAQDPFSGAVFVFRNSRRHGIKILWYDGQGFFLCLKRLSTGKFSWWPKSEQEIYLALAREVQVLLWNGMPQLSNFQPLWKPLTQAATFS